MTRTWPADFNRIPDDEWINDPVDDLARKYDNVEAHGWYDNLDPTLEQLGGLLKDDSLLIDYSGGTGILAARLYERHPQLSAQTIIVDASPKFLRLALDKLGHDDRVAYRWIRFLPEKRLQRLDEVLSESVLSSHADVIASTNAIHLYYDLPETLESWHRVLRPGGTALVQSGNIDNGNAAENTWIIDQTVELLQPHAREIVREDASLEKYRSVLDDSSYMEKHDTLRQKYFLPVRKLEHYVDALRSAGFESIDTNWKPIPAQVADWCEFLCAYHEGVLGWIGGASKITGERCSAEAITARLSVLRRSLERVFDEAPEFNAAWTYITARR
jgi:ubiquinone/menaquinone biosynthesis C-methylase UbiE